MSLACVLFNVHVHVGAWVNEVSMVCMCVCMFHGVHILRKL